MRMIELLGLIVHVGRPIDGFGGVHGCGVGQSNVGERMLL